MLIDFKSMLNKLTTPRSGSAVVKLTTASSVGLYVRNLDSESSVIKIAKDTYVFHVKPSDVILQGKYARGRKVHVIENLSELNNDYSLAQLDPSSNFYPLIDIPSGYRRKYIDDSLSNLTKALLSLVNETDISLLKGFDCHPVSELKFTVLTSLEQYELVKTKRSVFKEVVRIPHNLKAMLYVNHANGSAEFVIWCQPLNGEKEFSINIADGAVIKIIGNQAQMVFDTDVFNFGQGVLDNVTRPYKREEETTNVTKDAESVKLD